MLPIVVRTTEEAVRLVNPAIREGALALGMEAWKAIVLVTVPVRARRHRDGFALGHRTRCRRVRTAALHRVRQPVLELES